MTGADRREQIVRATMELLATHPPDRITTRLIAARVGVTQPALFRHFEGRDDILAATVAWTRGELEAIALAALRSPGDPLERVVALARGLGEYATRWPGLPRLLFADVVRGEGDTFAVGLHQLVAMQRVVVSGLVKDARREGLVPATLDAEGAARLFVAGMQGLLMQAQMEGRAPDVSALAAHWRAGVLAGEPRAERPEEGLAVVELDARPILMGGQDPLAAILAAVGTLAPGGRLRVVAPFRPVPLLALLESRGFAVACEEQGGGVYVVLADAP